MFRSEQFKRLLSSGLVLIAVALFVGVTQAETQGKVSYAGKDLRFPLSCYTWEIGQRVGLKGGAEIRHGSGLSYSVHTIVPNDDWLVDIIDGPRYADGYEWWDISRENLDGGGTGWVYIQQAAFDPCSPVPTRQPTPNPSSDSGLIIISLFIPSPPQVQPGEESRITFTVKNITASTLYVRRLGVRGRYNSHTDGESADFQWLENIQLESQEEYEYSFSRSFPHGGYWHLTPFYQDSNESWIEIRNSDGASVARGVTVPYQPIPKPVILSPKNHEIIGQSQSIEHCWTNVGYDPYYNIRISKNGTPMLSWSTLGADTCFNRGYNYGIGNYSWYVEAGQGTQQSVSDTSYFSIVPDDEAPTPTPTVAPPGTVQSGYLPGKHGWSINNSDVDNSSMGWREFMNVFGAEQVQNSQGIPWPAALIYYGLYFRDIAKRGVCSGMSTSALAYFKEKSQLPSGIGAPPDELLFNLNVLNSPAKQNVFDWVRYYQGVQLGQQVTEAREQAQGRDFDQQLSQIAASIDNRFSDPMLLSIAGVLSGRCGAHLLIPYAYIKEDAVLKKLLVYDPNYPGKSRTVLVNGVSNSWEYQMNENSIWSSNSSIACRNGKEFLAMPFSAYKQQPVPLWNTVWEAASDVHFSFGDNLAFVTDEEGRRLGIVADDYISEIPQSYVNIPEGVIPGRELTYPLALVLKGTDVVTATVTYTAASQSSIGFIKGDFGFEISEAIAGIDELTVNTEESSIQLLSGTDATREATITNKFGENSWEWKLSDLGVSENQLLSVAIGESGRLTITADQVLPAQVLTVTTVSDEENSSVSVVLPQIESGNTHIISTSFIDGASTIVYVDEGSDGSVEQVIEIGKHYTNQIFLPIVSR